MKKKKKFSAPLPKGKHIINLYVDWDTDSAGVFLQGDYEVYKTLLINAAIEEPEFARAFLDAALRYAHVVNDLKLEDLS